MVRNALIAALPPDEMKAFTSELESVDLPLKRVLQEAETPISHVWFPVSGVASAVSTMGNGATVELGKIGYEGFIGVHVLLGSLRGTYNVFMQAPGHGFRMPAAVFTRLLRELPSLQPLLLRYALTLVTQIAQGAACNQLHPIEARCARWLLMIHDRVDEDNFQLTQEALSQMLGVTRASTSIAAAMLQRAGYIRYIRGVIHIADREGLEGASCECYAVIAKDFKRLSNPQSAADERLWVKS